MPKPSRPKLDPRDLEGITFDSGNNIWSLTKGLHVAANARHKASIRPKVPKKSRGHINPARITVREDRSGGIEIRYTTGAGDDTITICSAPSSPTKKFCPTTKTRRKKSRSQHDRKQRRTR